MPAEISGETVRRRILDFRVILFAILMPSLNSAGCIYGDHMTNVYVRNTSDRTVVVEVIEIGAPPHRRSIQPSAQVDLFTLESTDRSVTFKDPVTLKELAKVDLTDAVIDKGMRDGNLYLQYPVPK